MARKPKPDAWRNAITRYADEAPESLLANPQNWRLHPKEQTAALTGSLTELGWIAPVIVNETTQHVVDGHARIGEAIARGEPTVPVAYVSLTEDQERLALATFDPIAAMAGTDQKMLDDLLAGLVTDEDGLSDLLESLASEQPKQLNPDDADLTPPTEPITKPGDLWLMGEHRLLCGDSTNADDVARLMNGEQCDMVFTDPPYGVDYDGGAKKRERLDGDHVGTSIYADALPNLQIAASNEAALYLWYADAHVAAAAAAGYVITAQIIWVKNNAQFVSAAKYHGKHEPCFYAHRKGHSAAWYGSNNEVTVWEVDRASRNDYHPTQKPVELSERAILNSSPRHGSVLDLFGGSGSTMIAAEQTARVAYLMEIQPAYCDVIVRRWEKVTGKVAVRG